MNTAQEKKSILRVSNKTYGKKSQYTKEENYCYLYTAKYSVEVRTIVSNARVLSRLIRCCGVSPIVYLPSSSNNPLSRLSSTNPSFSSQLKLAVLRFEPWKMWGIHGFSYNWFVLFFFHFFYS